MLVGYGPYSRTSHIKQPTCYKYPSHLICIDLIFTNVPRCFQTTCVIETGIVDFHLMTLTVIRTTFKKLKPRVVNHRFDKHLSNEVFRESLLEKLSQQIFVNNDNGFETFCSFIRNPLSANPTTWSNKLKQFVGNLFECV